MSEAIETSTPRVPRKPSRWSRFVHRVKVDSLIACGFLTAMMGVAKLIEMLFLLDLPDTVTSSPHFSWPTTVGVLLLMTVPQSAVLIIAGIATFLLARRLDEKSPHAPHRPRMLSWPGAQNGHGTTPGTA